MVTRVQATTNMRVRDIDLVGMYAVHYSRTIGIISQAKTVYTTFVSEMNGRIFQKIEKIDLTNKYE